jgi:hypothetical protein
MFKLFIDVSVLLRIGIIAGAEQRHELGASARGDFDGSSGPPFEITTLVSVAFGVGPSFSLYFFMTHGSL